MDDVDPYELGFPVFVPCTPNIFKMLHGCEYADWECEEIIPLKLFSDCEILRSQYPNVHSSVAGSSIPDDEWQAVYVGVLRVQAARDSSATLVFAFGKSTLFRTSIPSAPNGI